MSAKSEIGLIDRGTMWFWNLFNLAGWSLLALGSAVFFTMAMLSTASLLDYRYPHGGNGWWRLLTLIVAPAVALVALSVGSLIGGRVNRWQRSVAAGLCLLNAALSLAYLDHWIGYLRGSLIVVGVLALAAPLAALVAGRAASRRPRALAGLQ